ncbi:Hcp family type VI secretion system effector [Ornithinimicrobium tianjinense]|uniref:Type VI secretion system secreted protein Hcp n=1 Tax=Ornithinimicrobium tianjinense TaxID=1195761 RepID=A0A917BFH8_9MICO|nr:type VI secretion system tube protein TssD [Ornithinimicrobium tianjinense]GGF39691.1 hypothetical protein GCM10011366_04140 [Ornithinimicrobium tianjinense]
MDATLTLVGPHGPVRGGSGRPDGRGGGGIAVLDVRHTLNLSWDTATGRASGRRQHAPVVVTKEVDRSSPVLAQAWAQNLAFTTWTLEVFGVDGLGRRAPAYTLELRRAVVVQITLSAGHDAALPWEMVSFAYDRIVWTWPDGQVTASDDWASTP